MMARRRRRTKLLTIAAASAALALALPYRVPANEDLPSVNPPAEPLVTSATVEGLAINPGAPAAPVPEPAMLVFLLGSGVILVALSRRRTILTGD